MRVARPLALATSVTVTAYGYNQWNKAKAPLKLSTNNEEMLRLFDRLDKDKSGTIDRSELEAALTSAGHAVNILALEAMLSVADEDKDGQISKDEWLRICHAVNGDSVAARPKHVPTATAAKAAPAPAATPTAEALKDIDHSFRK